MQRWDVFRTNGCRQPVHLCATVSLYTCQKCTLYRCVLLYIGNNSIYNWTDVLRCTPNTERGCSRINQEHVLDPDEGIAYLKCPENMGPIGPEMVYCDGEDWYETIGECVPNDSKSTIGSPATNWPADAWSPSAAASDLTRHDTIERTYNYNSFENEVIGMNNVIINGLSS